MSQTLLLFKTLPQLSPQSRPLNPNNDNTNMSLPVNPFGVFPSASPHTAPPMTRPADLDTTSLTTASGAQLNYWIDAANNGLPKKVLTKTGTVDIRRQRLADYYGIDLSATPVTPSVGPISRDADITKRQWEHLRAVEAEWAAKDLVGTPFQLVSNAPPSSHGMSYFFRSSEYLFLFHRQHCCQV
jgi:hypothetical protein